MNILYISHESSLMSGSALSLYDMIKSLEKYNVKIYVLMPIHCHAYIFFKKNNIMCDVVNYKMNIVHKENKIKYLITYIPRLIIDTIINHDAINKIYSLFKNKKIDIVHSNTSVIDIGPIIAKKLRAKHVWHIREFQDLDFNIAPFKGWHKLLNQIYQSDATIAISKEIYQHYKCEKCKKAFIIHDAVISKNKYNFIPQKENIILFCGIVGSAKQPDMAIDIFKSFHDTHPQYKLNIVGKIGNENYLKYLLNKIKTYSLEDSVNIIGYSENVDAEYQKAKILLMCSKNEAQGRVTIEAMYNQCIVIGLNKGGTSSIIRNEINGFLFNTIQEATEILTRIINDYESYKYVINNAQEYVNSNFSSDSYGEKIYNIYLSLINNNNEKNS